MFIACPHCRELVALDRETRLAPDLCPRCGGALRESAATETPVTDAPAAGERSFISFLKADDATATDKEATTTVTGAETTDEAMAADLVSSAQAGEEAGGSEAGAEPIDELAPGIESRVIDTAGDEAPATATVIDTPAVSTPAPIAPARPAMPSFTRQDTRPGTHPRTAKWQWALLIALSLTLALQVLIADRTRLAADASWRPLIARLCNALGCSVPPWHQPGAFTMLSRDVRPIAGATGGLNMQATFRNDARWAQAWPVLLLSLSDADGRVLGSRAFTPREYLGASVAQTELAPGQSAQIALQLHEPNPNVVAFTFDFR